MVQTKIKKNEEYRSGKLCLYTFPFLFLLFLYAKFQIQEL